MKYEHAIAAAKEYQEGLKIRRQIKALSTKSLALKFERRQESIRDIEKGKHPRNIPEDERKLILSCIEERKRLEGLYRGKTMEELKAKYHTSGASIQGYLEAGA